MKTHIISILYHEPDYDYMEDKKRPAVNWDTSDGNWVGIYRNEIPDKLGEEILKTTDEFEYEVWQPDYRADKMRSHRFEDGLVHRLFPAQRVKVLRGLKYENFLRSPALIDFLLAYSADHQVIINVNGGFILFNLDILKSCGHLPILQTFRGTMVIPQTQIFKFRLNFLASWNYYRDHLKTKKVMPNVDYVMHQNDLYLKELSEIYKGPVLKITSGCDFNFWKKTDKLSSRASLDIPEGKMVFFVSSLFKPLKQIDKLIETFKKLDSQYDFMLIISGHGMDDYEDYLQDLAQPLIEKDKLRFVGYVTGDQLRRFYNSADLFVNTSVSEGGPVSAMKAIACETPIFTTDIGNVAESMRKNGTGIVVPIGNYQQWETQLSEVLDGKEVRRFDRQEAEKLYDWEKIASGFVDVFRHLDKQFYKKEEKTTFNTTQ